MGRNSYRDHIVESGMQTVYRRGFATAGIREITAAAGVAQGSFTNHFASKEDFGVAVIDHYFEQIRGVIARTLRDETLDPMARLHAYFDAIIALFADLNWHYGCLAGNMALEASEHSETIRHRLVAIFAEWSVPFADAVRDAQELGHVRPDLDPDEVGAALLEAWHGAMLRMKVERTSEPLERFLQFVLPALLGVQDAGSSVFQTRLSDRQRQKPKPKPRKQKGRPK
jgi:TetR/AcrR family transcriptional repressor of nem operon